MSDENETEMFGQPPWAKTMEHRIIEKIGTLTMGIVTIEQDDLTAFAGMIESEVASINTSNATIAAAVGVLTTYIQTLITGQATPLPAADETEINTALSDLDAGVTAVTSSVAALTGLEPPAPAPEPTPDA